MWQMGGLGPMQGQLEHFRSWLPRNIDHPNWSDADWKLSRIRSGED
jgi:hypothetical protein